RMAAARTVEEAAETADELRDRYGEFPAPVANLMEVVWLRALCRRAGVASVAEENGRVLLRLAAARAFAPHEVKALRTALHGRVSQMPDAVVLRTGAQDFGDRARWIREALETLIRLTGQREVVRA
ncbi:MAG: hypothetical protein HY660_10455, partial [Armatimonadetes bacterium]|nr:hypothetical protein [Armatimonadota bacterium]